MFTFQGFEELSFNSFSTKFIEIKKFCVHNDAAGLTYYSVQCLLRQDARIQDMYFNISEMKLSITTLYIISDAPNYYII